MDRDTVEKRGALTMATKRDTSNASDHVLLASKCLAISVDILNRTKSSTAANQEEIRLDHHAVNHGKSGAKNKVKHTIGDLEEACSSNFDGFKTFKRIQACNSQCYWNASLLDAVRNLQYCGCLADETILASGQSEHVEAFKSAWSKRLLKSPDGISIKSIGEIGDILMQPVTQSQFIPLPDALCIVIHDLASSQEPPTLDGIRNRLKSSYKEMCTPPDQIIYETLEQLVRERKIIHTANGYFIVTPNPCASAYPLNHQESPALCSCHQFCAYSDHFPSHGAFPLHGGLTTNSPLCPTLPPKVHTTSRSCQTHRQKSSESKEKHKERVKEIKSERKSCGRRLERSQSVERDYGKGAEQCEKMETFKRSASVRYDCDEKSKAVMKDVNSQHSNIHQDKDKGEKGWLLSKLFSKGKKSKPVNEVDEKAKTVQCVTFSAQFPPPEWEWYSKEHLVSKVQKSATWHCMQPPPYCKNDTNNQNKRSGKNERSRRKEGDVLTRDIIKKQGRHQKAMTLPAEIDGICKENDSCYVVPAGKSHEKSQKALMLPVGIDGTGVGKSGDNEMLAITDSVKKGKAKSKRKSRLHAKGSGYHVQGSELRQTSKLSRSKSMPSGEKCKNRLMGPKEQEDLLPVTGSQALVHVEKGDICNVYSSKNGYCAEMSNGLQMSKARVVEKTAECSGHNMLLDCVDDLTSLDDEQYELQCRSSTSSECTLQSVVRNYTSELSRLDRGDNYQTASDVEVCNIMEEKGNLDGKHGMHFVAIQNGCERPTVAVLTENVFSDESHYCAPVVEGQPALLDPNTDSLSLAHDLSKSCVESERVCDENTVPYSPKHESRFSCKSNKARKKMDGVVKDKNQNEASKIGVQNNLGDSGFNSPLTNPAPVTSKEEKLQNNLSMSHQMMGSQLSIEGNTLRSSEYYPSNPHLKFIRETDLDEDLYLNDNGPKGDFGQDFEVVGMV